MSEPVVDPEVYGFPGAGAPATLLREANEANARLAALQDLTARLGTLTRPEEVAEVVLGQGVADLGGASGSLCLLSADGTSLEVAAHVGYTDEVTTSWGRFPLAAATPAGDAVRHGEAIYVSTQGELHDRYPIFGGRSSVGDEALAVLPLKTSGHDSLGAMVIGFTRSREFPAADRRMLAALAAQAANTLARTQSRAALEAAREQLAYLADASARLASSLDLEQTAATVASLAVPHLSDRCSMYLLRDGQVVHLVLEPAELDADIRTVLSRYPVDLDAPTGVGAVLRTGVAEFVPEVDDAVLEAEAVSPDHLELIRRIGFGALLILPLQARGHMVGALVLTNGAGRTMTGRERTLADELAARAAVAVDNALLFARHVEVSERLQASLLPPVLPPVAGLDLAARYSFAGEGIDVGGDFYDCVAAGPDRWLLVVGDVKGKGIEAAAQTGLARHTLRAAALNHMGPGAALKLLNDALLLHEHERGSDDPPDWESGEPRFCTAAAVALVRHDDRFEATIASAGHPLPLLRERDGTSCPVGRPGDAIGIQPAIDLPETTVALEPGAVMVCFTDGVVECHAGGRFFGESGLTEVLARSSGTAGSVAEAIEAAARGFTGRGMNRDDMAILVARVLP
jgi:serine phosphatase RsbU (regulator of sigma subunit)